MLNLRSPKPGPKSPRPAKAAPPQAAPAGPQAVSSSSNFIRDQIVADLESKRFGDRVVLNGHAEQCLPNTLHINFRGVIGAELLEKLPELAASTGSACHAGEITLSSVLEAMQIPAELGMGEVRFSLGRYIARQDNEQAVPLITQIF